MRRFLRRFGWARYCILTHLKQVRAKQADARWEYNRTMMSLIGQISIYWSGAEAMIDTLINWYHPIAGAKQIRAELPRSTKTRIAYLNKMLRDPSFNQSAVEHIRRTKMELKRLSTQRHVLMHGLIFDTGPKRLQWEIQIRRYARDGASSHVDRYHFTATDLAEVVKQHAAFIRFLSPWIEKMIELKPPQAQPRGT